MKMTRRGEKKPPHQEWSVYLVRCRDRSLYTGIAINVARRLTEHRQSSGRGAKYLSGRGPLRLVFHRRLGGKSLALQVEYRIKRLPKEQKERLVKTGDLSIVGHG